MACRRHYGRGIGGGQCARRACTSDDAYVSLQARTIQSFALSELQPLDEYAPINEYIVLDTPASAGDAEFKALGGSDSLDKGKGVGESDSPGEGKALGSEPLDEAKESNTSDVVETN